MTDSAAFFDALPSFDTFDGVVDPANYRPLPDGWALAVADVVGSTDAIGAGRYKTVNYVGAAVIAAIQNEVACHRLPFAFGGDGALVALAPAEQEGARVALAAVATWSAEELELELRAALVPVADIRAAGHDVRAARFCVTPYVAYAMFAGGGANWADREVKAGRFLVAPAPPETKPDLTGLSCRFLPMRARSGVILSIIAMPREGVEPAAFGALVAQLLEVLAAQDRSGHPVPVAGPQMTWPPRSLTIEASASPPRARLRARARVLLESGVARLSDRAGRSIGGFDAREHYADSSANADFRKFDDGLKLTVDVSDATCERIDELLVAAARAGVCRYGTHRQDEALITCIVPSHTSRDHVHFVDGAAGGYAMAAAMLKAAG